MVEQEKEKGYSGDDPYVSERERMVELQIERRGVKDPRVLEAMRRVPRHMFVGEQLKNQAYEDHPLPIGEGQTISQPYIVALMTEALNLKGSEKVLEIGTGSGYQTAVLAELCREVFTIERIASLAYRARKTLESLGYKNIKYKIGDGTLGWPEEAPFDGIIVTAAAPKVPQPLIDQLAMGARLVIPVGDRISQELLLVERVPEGIRKTSLGGVRFVDLVGKWGWREE
ncbi:protein-L-isoaspartate(D-aspartate) O-methyltransferase [Thermodesulforhabdus norvegica]|uniref:Protein-L-isoaspartate O-methyltransferase n=1 Tax=Thermodesulforhabdus norvegica TaxID=39841 RepID=A0A1I4SWH0_9BACT|nr:protein-L-isoaspartate(D-aspartate) O-methyltransferase [Thermodesulforhabdus norvegica]SFM68771.1 protein-L-isoaspartate(D-aspartate) O-methyltransferase [Thermodesulforhabdus norvegica]